MTHKGSCFKFISFATIYIILVTIGTSILTACGNTAPTDSATTSTENIASTDSATTSTKSIASTDSDVTSEENMSRKNAVQNESSMELSQDSSTSDSSETVASNNSSIKEATTSESSNFAGYHGALRVQGADLVDENGDNIQLYGMSTHGIGWFPQFVNYDSFRTLRDDWNTNCVRLALYTAENNGYCTGGDKEQLRTLIKNGVDYATELGMYVIIDWHILSEQDPNVYKEEAKTFFDEISSTYANDTNILYEICNEPNGCATWDSIKSYADEIISVIRANDSDAVILVGTPTWSQDIDWAVASPLEYDNIMYTLHFYAGTHKDELRNRLDTCVMDGLPVFVSEFGMCDASGNGANDFDSSAKWLELLDQYNISYCCWNLANKDESSSVFKSSTTSLSDWTIEEMNESGIWIRDYFRNKSE